MAKKFNPGATTSMPASPQPPKVRHRTRPITPPVPATSKAARQDPPDEDVGYARPPKATRFKPGRSGNPNGRPKSRPKDTHGLLEKILEGKIDVTERGQRKKYSVREVLLKTVTNKAASGDLRALSAVMKLMKDYLPEAPPPQAEEAQLPQCDQDILDSYVKRRMSILQKDK